VLLNFGDIDWGEVGASLEGERFLFPPFFPLFVLTRNKVKYFSPMTNLCIYVSHEALRQTRPGQHSRCWTEWAEVSVAVVQMDTRCQGRPTCNSCLWCVLISWPSFLLSFIVMGLCCCCARFYDIDTLKHAQIAAIQWNRQVIARVKAGMDVSCHWFISCYHPWVLLTTFTGPQIGAVPRRGNDVVKHFEMSMQEIGELQD
jgi:hypothetical protein